MTNKYSHPTDLNSNPNKYPEMPGNYNPQNHSDNQNTGFREFSEYAQPTDLNPQKKQPSQYPDLYKKEPQKTDNEKKAHKVNFEPEAIKVHHYFLKPKVYKSKFRAKRKRLMRISDKKTSPNRFSKPIRPQQISASCNLRIIDRFIKTIQSKQNY